MLNLIKMDLYRLFKTKSFKIGLIISALISFLAIAGIAGIINLVHLLSNASQESLSMFPFVNWQNSVNLYEIILTATSVLSLMVSAVLASHFISEEQSNGYVKNIAGQVKDKGMMIVSKFVALSVISFSVMLTYALGSTISGFIFFNSAITYTGISQFLLVFGTKYIIYLAVNAILLFLCTITKSKSLALAVGVMFGSGATIIVYNVISTFAGIALKCDIPVSSYVPDGLIFGLTMDATSNALIKALIVGVVYIAVFIIFSMVSMRKRDTK